MNPAIDKLTKLMKEYEIDAAIVTQKQNIRYFSGFTSEDATLLLHPDECYLITDFRYIEQANLQCPTFKVIDAPGTKIAHFLKETLKKLDASRIWFEDNNLSYRTYTALSEELQNHELIPDNDILSSLRIRKTSEEICSIRKAASLSDKGFEYILNRIRPSVTEREIAIELEFFLRKNGSEELAFSIIAASGKNGSLPHAEPSDKKLCIGEFLTLDFGCVVNGYCSDMTRTVALGNIDSKLKEIYEITLQAQKMSLDYIGPGKKGIEVDKVARDYISSYGYGDYFGHGLGHGVGLNVHEAPTLSTKGEMLLEPGMVVSVEPGIYLPSKGGVRIEDLVVITETGYENLVSSPKHLIQL
ncbi:MAG: M24 family metallopeptidase [Caldicoprobacterales bacterium]|nr:aminopeptidase P family protein [Clostridiales bacterium]